MWKKTIKTIRDNPKMLWGFIVPVLAGLVLTFPIYRSIVLTLLGDYSRIDDVPNFREVVRSFAIAAPIVYILMGVLVLPPLYGYVYKAVTGNEKKIWSKDGLLKYSWRVVVKSFLNFLTLFSIFIVLFLFFAVPGLGFALYTIAFSAWGVFWIISLTSAIVEDRFIDSFPNTFFVGGRYYLKMYLTSTLVMTPAILFSAWFLIYFHGVGMDIAYAVPTLNMDPKIIILIFLSIAGFLSVYYVFAQCFLFTYSMHYDIVEREKLDEEDRLKALAEEDNEEDKE